MKWHRAGGRLVLVAIVITLTLLAGEYGLRRAIFSSSPAFARLRNPQLYASYDSDDYWKLQYLFGSPFSEPRQSDPTVGWRGEFGEDFRHADEKSIGKRRPVLLFGDSFSNHGVKRIHEYFNEDRDLSARCYMLNYGVGGYGLDQIHLVFKNSVPRFRNPIVVYSFLVDDMGRALLSLRTGQKPHVEFSDGKPRIVIPKFEPSVADFIQKHPLTIRSYLYRMLVFGNVFPWKIVAPLQGVPELKRSDRAIASAFTTEAVQIARERGFPLNFLLFSEELRLARKDGYRALAEEVLKAQPAEHWFAGDLIAEDRARSGNPLSHYFIPDGHPSSAQLELIFAAIRRKLLRICRSGGA